MGVQIQKHTITTNEYTFNALSFAPEIVKSPTIALFTHGYTSNKVDCLPWAQRLSEAGIHAVIFDQPGHYLGSFNEVESFEHYKENAHTLFIDVFNTVKNSLNTDFENIILGGHSLGALLSLKASKLDFFNDYQTTIIGVGIGISQHKEVHLFESSFYQKTLNIRRQLVCQELDSKNVFPWIKNEKLHLDLQDQEILLITGLDDAVVGPGGAKALEENLKVNNNVILKEPKKLPHHEPSMAGTHIYSFIKKKFSL
ncbi:MAG: lysophospholipase [Bacteriovoracaceae bacterium]|jgi:predicted esterase|nr:lysophospholipase [Bacteriovoracaceae bacterium]